MEASGPFTRSSAATPATASGSGSLWCGGSPKPTGALRSRKTGWRAARGWALRCALLRDVPRSGLLEHCAHDPPDHPQLVPGALAEVVAELGDLVPTVAVEVVEQRAQRHIQPGGQFVHGFQGWRERAALDPSHRVDRQRALLRQLLLCQLTGMPERPEMR